MTEILGDFYSVVSKGEPDGDKRQWTIQINPKHEIFKGHFPGNPITPGVCMIQIIRELAEEDLGKKLFLFSANNVKFMAIINPETDPILQLDLQITEKEDFYSIKCTARFDETVALKFSGSFRPVS